MIWFGGPERGFPHLSGKHSGTVEKHEISRTALFAKDACTYNIFTVHYFCGFCLLLCDVWCYVSFYYRMFSIYQKISWNHPYYSFPILYYIINNHKVSTPKLCILVQNRCFLASPGRSLCRHQIRKTTGRCLRQCLIFLRNKQAETQHVLKMCGFGKPKSKTKIISSGGLHSVHWMASFYPSKR